MTRRDQDTKELLDETGYLTVHEFARHLKEYHPDVAVSFPVVYRMIEKGQLKATKVGSHNRIRAAEIARYVKEGNREIPPEPAPQKADAGQSTQSPDETDAPYKHAEYKSPRKVLPRADRQVPDPTEAHQLNPRELLRHGKRYNEKPKGKPS